MTRVVFFCLQYIYLCHVTSVSNLDPDPDLGVFWTRIRGSSGSEFGIRIQGLVKSSHNNFTF